MNICASEKPQKPIRTYNFGVFEGQDNYIAFLTGINIYEVSQNHTETKIDYTPAEMYFSLPANEYKNLNRQQVFERLTLQLKEFTKSDQFKNSFFQHAESITTDWKGEIWRK